MTTPTPAGLFSEPSIVHLRALLSEVHRGLIQLPAFQRGLVWRLKDRLQILDSVYRGIPIGTIMIWRTTLQSVRVMPNVGPHLVDDPKPVLRQLVIDGGQRMAALYGALYPIVSGKFAEDEVDESQENFVVYADVSRDEIQFVVSQANEIPHRALLPVSLLLDSSALLRWLRERGGASDEVADRVDELAARFRDYKLPVVAAAGDDISIAIQTFQRVNRAGTKMSDVHMIRALTWSNDFDLTARFEDGRRLLLVDRGWEGIDDDLLLKCLRVAMSLPIYEEKASESELFAKTLNGDPSPIDKMFGSLGRVVDFLANRCGILRPSLLPYTMQLPCLVAAFAEGELAEPVLGRLEAWLWLTTYAELFASISGYRLEVVVAHLRDIASGATAQLVWPGGRAFSRKSLPAKFDFRHARARALALRLAELQGTEGAQLLATLGARSLSSLTTREQGGTFARPGAKFLIRPASPAQLRELFEFEESSLRVEHCVSDATSEFLAAGRIREAIDQRTKDLEALEVAFVAKYEHHLASLEPQPDPPDQMSLFDDNA